MLAVGSVHEASHALQVTRLDRTLAFLTFVLPCHHVLLRVLVPLVVLSHDVDQNVLDRAEEILTRGLGGGYIDILSLGVAVRLLVDKLDQLLVDCVRLEICHAAHLSIHILTL